MGASVQVSIVSPGDGEVSFPHLSFREMLALKAIDGPSTCRLFLSRVVGFLITYYIYVRGTLLTQVSHSQTLLHSP